MPFGHSLLPTHCCVRGFEDISTVIIIIFLKNIIFGYFSVALIFNGCERLLACFSRKTESNS